MTYRHLKPAPVKLLLEGPEGWTYVDVRTPEEFQAGHVAGSWNVPFALRDATGRMTANPEFVAVVKKIFPRDARLVLGCASGGRSQRACELLSAEGYADLVNMQNGFSGMHDETGRIVEPGWQGCGYACETAAPVERTYTSLRSRK